MPPSPLRAPRLPVRALADALTWPHGVDRYLELIRPTASSSEIRARVVRSRRQTPDTLTLVLRPNRQWPGLRAGQHVQLTVEIDGVRRWRPYSPATSEHARDGLLELTLKVHEHGLVSRHLADHIRPGSTVVLSPPQGDFTLPASRPRHLLLVSGGTGITPLLSMLRTLADEGHTGSVTLLHYSLDAGHVLYRSELDELAWRLPGLRVLHAFTEQTDGADLHGFLDPTHLDAADRRWTEAEVYACGPPPLLDALWELAAGAGREAHLHVEAFEAPLRRMPPADDAAPTGETIFVRSGRRAANRGATLLEQAEAAGLRPESGCRMGVCLTCTSHKLGGTTRDLRTGALDSRTDCDIQLCVNVALDDLEVLL